VAINSLGKLALFQDQADLLANFLNLLPLKAEAEEAQQCHKMLFNQIKQQNPILMAFDLH